MARSRERGRLYREKLVRLLALGPSRPSELSGRSRWRALGRTLGELIEDNLTDRAAVLTYYGMLAIFPGLLVLVAVVGLLGPDTSETVAAGLQDLSFGPAQQILADTFRDVQRSPGQAGVLAIVGFLIAFYSAAGYVGAFIRAANAIYDVPEGRPMWKTLPLRFFITIIVGMFFALSALAVVFTGELARRVGDALNIDEKKISLFEIVKWPILVLIFAMLMALLYWAAPNARQAGFRWITPGSLLATGVWVAVSGGFAYYISHFDSYDRIYGTLGGVVVFLVWIWLTNVAVLLGAEFDAELARERAIAAGLPHQAEPYLPLRDLPADQVLVSADDLPHTPHNDV